MKRLNINAIGYLLFIIFVTLTFSIMFVSAVRPHSLVYEGLVTINDPNAINLIPPNNKVDASAILPILQKTALTSVNGFNYDKNDPFALVVNDMRKNIQNYKYNPHTQYPLSDFENAIITIPFKTYLTKYPNSNNQILDIQKRVSNDIMAAYNANASKYPAQ
jgi:hypothetical protein